MPVPDAEIASRITLLKRFRELLQSQRERFEAYLTVLDKQKDKIESGSVEDLLAHVDLEEKIVADIISIQKVAEPLKAVIPQTALAKAPDIASIAETIDALHEKAAASVIRNKELLSTRMGTIREELKDLRANPFTRKQSPYGAREEPSFIDIKI